MTLHVMMRLTPPDTLREMVESWRDEGITTEYLPDDGDEAEFRARLAHADALAHQLRPFTAEAIAHGPRLKLVQKLGAGVNTIDVETCRARGIAVCNMPGVNPAAVAEQTVLLALAALRRLPEQLAQARVPGWPMPPDLAAAIDGLDGRRVGLFGGGEIAQRVARAMRALGAEVAYANRSERAEMQAERMAPGDLAAWADVISLHLPLTDDTAHLVDAALLARMRPGSVLVNTARGGLVDEAALLAALAQGRPGFAALDVLDREPPPEGHPLLDHPRAIVTPHVAWMSMGTWRRSLERLLVNLRLLRDGADLNDRVA